MCRAYSVVPPGKAAEQETGRFVPLNSTHGMTWRDYWDATAAVARFLRALRGAPGL
ncbi:hypothetical protein NFC73_08425 [Pseudarthrobacter sp. RMG13]|uniref:Uncharacterized protein n=1 Tax=Pseudarthrobacter humi TaxID=2952523 RepID=A0ABT1LMU5_9MICC|nr:hypothetical protein [Pseudarthrobacter humi]